MTSSTVAGTAPRPAAPVIKFFERYLKGRFEKPEDALSILTREPIRVLGRKLLRVADLPLDWAGQRRVLGFNYDTGERYLSIEDLF